MAFRVARRLPRKPTLVDREILRFTYHYRSLDDILQFANVSRPGIRLKQFQTLFVHPADALSRFPRLTIDEVLDEHWTQTVRSRSRRGWRAHGDAFQHLVPQNTEQGMANNHFNLVRNGIVQVRGFERDDVTFSF